MKLSKLWKNYNLGIVLFLLFLVTWIGQGFFEWQLFKSEQETHNQAVATPDFIYEFSQSTLENWQSEFLQLFSFVILTTYLVYRGSHESKDSSEKMQKDIVEIKQFLKKRGAR